MYFEKNDEFYRNIYIALKQRWSNVAVLLVHTRKISVTWGYSSYKTKKSIDFKAYPISTVNYAHLFLYDSSFFLKNTCDLLFILCVFVLLMIGVLNCFSYTDFNCMFFCVIFDQIKMKTKGRVDISKNVFKNTS